MRPYREIILENLNIFFHHVEKNSHHTPLESSKYFVKTKRHPPICKSYIWTCKFHVLLILWDYWNMIIAWISIQKAIIGLPCQPLSICLNKWKEKVILPRGIVELLVVIASPPSNHRPCLNKLIILIFYIATPLFFGTTWRRIIPCTIQDRDK